MTYRHHYAELEFKDDHSATYKYTPDSIKKEFWRRVQFNLKDYSVKVQKYADDPDNPQEWQDNICLALASKFKKLILNNKGIVPKILEFIA